MTTAKILEVGELQERLEDLRRQGRAIVQCHGCFDIVHPGHIRYLRFAREQGDILVVSVSSDRMVGKGFDRPHIPARHRLENLAELECVDFVVLDDNNWAGPILEVLRPDVYVKGKEYEDKSDPRFTRERALVESYGGQVIFSSGDVVYSSTALIQRYGERFSVERDKLRAFCETWGISADVLQRQLRGFVGKRVLMVGDAILDHYVHCESAGVASESPMLSVRPVGESWYPGGSAFIARQLQALGADVTLVVPVSAASKETDRFVQRVEEDGIDAVVIDTPRQSVSVKQRYLVEEKKVLKVDRGTYSPLSATAMDETLRVVEQRLEAHEGVMLVDYGYGLFGARLASALPAAARHADKPLYVDISGSGKANLLKFGAVRLATPTEAELRFALGDEASGLSNLASRYFHATDAQHLIVTLGRRGSIHFHNAESGGRLPTTYLPAHFGLPLDVVGAGDAFLAATVLSDLAECPVAHGMYLGSVMASLHVGNLGNNPVDVHDLEAALAALPELTG